MQEAKVLPDILQEDLAEVIPSCIPQPITPKDFTPDEIYKHRLIELRMQEEVMIIQKSSSNGNFLCMIHTKQNIIVRKPNGIISGVIVK